MIKRKLALALVLFAVVGFNGCSKSESGSIGSFSGEFKSASPELKAQADLVVAAYKTNGYTVAFTTLQEMRTTSTKLPEKQETAIADMMAFVREQMTQQAAKGNAEAIKAQEELNQLRRR
jgi:hypothetical protein